MILTLIILCFIAFGILIFLSDSEKAIAIVEFGKKIDDKTANKIISKYPIDWYIFTETAIQEEEIEDLKQYYKLVLEVK